MPVGWLYGNISVSICSFLLNAPPCSDYIEVMHPTCHMYRNGLSRPYGHTVIQPLKPLGQRRHLDGHGTKPVFVCPSIDISVRAVSLFASVAAPRREHWQLCKAHCCGHINGMIIGIAFACHLLEYLTVLTSYLHLVYALSPPNLTVPALYRD